jgi:hypothetical protein
MSIYMISILYLLLLLFIIATCSSTNSKHITEHIGTTYASTYMYTRYGNALDSENTLISPDPEKQSWTQQVNPDKDGDGIVSESERLAYKGSVNRKNYDVMAEKNNCLTPMEEALMDKTYTNKINSLSGNEDEQKEAQAAHDLFKESIENSRDFCEDMKKQSLLL